VNRLAWLIRRYATTLAVGAGLLLIAAATALHGLAIRPLQHRLDALEARDSGPRDGKLERLGDDLAREDSPHAQLARFHAYFRQDDQLTDSLAKVYAIARSLGLEMKRAEYRLSSQPGRKLDRYQMTVPIQGSYTTIRAFVTTTLRAQPTMALEQVQFQRKDVGDTVVDAQISFTFYLAQ
jgi:hypothetical protein